MHSHQTLLHFFFLRVKGVACETSCWTCQKYTLLIRMEVVVLILQRIQFAWTRVFTVGLREENLPHRDPVTCFGVALCRFAGLEVALQDFQYEFHLFWLWISNCSGPTFIFFWSTFHTSCIFLVNFSHHLCIVLTNSNC